MSTADAASHLRQRAAALRRFAGGIAHADALDLYRRADRDTWLGPTPDACRSDLAAMRRDLLAAVDDLHATARRYDDQAAVLAAMPDPNGPR